MSRRLCLTYLSSKIGFWWIIGSVESPCLEETRGPGVANWKGWAPPKDFGLMIGYAARLVKPSTSRSCFVAETELIAPLMACFTLSRCESLSAMMSSFAFSLPSWLLDFILWTLSRLRLPALWLLIWSAAIISELTWTFVCSMDPLS